MDKLLLKPAEAADAIGLSRSKVYELIGAGQLPSVRVGTILRVPVEGLRAWVLSNTAGGSDSVVP